MKWSEFVNLHASLVYQTAWRILGQIQWKQGKTLTLLVQTDAMLSWYSRFAYPIPAKYRQEVDAVLEQKLGRTSIESP